MYGGTGRHSGFKTRRRRPCRSDPCYIDHFYLLGCLSIGRKAGFEPANRGSSPRAPTNAVVMEQADMRDSNPRALKSVQVQFLPAAPIFWTATSMADYAPFKRWNEGSTPSRSTILRPHSLVEERQVLNLLAGVRFSLRPPIFTPSVNMMVLLNMALSVMGRQLAFQAGKYGSSPYRATIFGELTEPGIVSAC